MKRLSPGLVLGMWSAVCLIAMIVGFATLTSHANGNGDLLTAASSPTLSDGAIAAMALALWLVGIVLLVLVVGARRILRRMRRSAGAQ